ncbi:MAG: hypothetical protein ABSF43_10185 [Rectinemataceae bacterium]
MRRRLMVLIIIGIALVAIPSITAQARLDVGVIAPRGAGLTLGNGTTDFGSQVDSWPFIPVPEAGLYYQDDLGFLKLGLGGRAFTMIFETIVWPNAFAEFDFGKVAIEAQFGGGAFLLFGLLPAQANIGSYFIPDISAWYKFGKKGIFRLGGGVIGLYLPQVLGDALPFLIYLGGKVSVML